MKNIFKIVIILILISLIIFFSYTQFSIGSKSEKPIKPNKSVPIEVSTPQDIFRPGYYQLTTDLIPSSMNRTKSGSCNFFGIFASDVVFDGMGHVIDGSKISPSCTFLGGFYFMDSPGDKFKFPRITVRNITVMNVDSGFQITGVHDFRLENVTIISNKFGTLLRSSSNVSFINNIFTDNACTIQCWDNEQITFNHNRITNSRCGIYAEGEMQAVPAISILGQKISLIYFTTSVTKKTSGTEYVISNNFIQNISGNGIFVGNVNDVKITDNIISNSSAGIATTGSRLDLLIANNTFYGNSKDIYTGYAPKTVPMSAIIGTILIFLLPILTRIFTGSSKIIQKIIGTSLAQKILTKVRLVEDHINAVLRNSSISILIRNPVTITIAGALIFGVAYAYATSAKLTLVSFSNFPVIASFSSVLVISGIVTVTPRAIQYLVAKKNSLVTEYQIWWGGIFVILLTMFLPFGSIFGQPIKMEISDKELMEQKKILLSKISGPLTTILLSVGFFALDLLKVTPYAMTGLQMSLLASVVMLLPTPPVEGEHIWKWNKITWGVLFFPVLIVYFYFIIIPV